jgi:hypothetical protein
MKTTPSQRDRLCNAIQPDRLLATARQLIAVPSRTGDAGTVLDCLAISSSILL